MKVVNHKLEGVKFSPSPNVSGRIKQHAFIVMHYTAGWTADSAINTLTNRDAKVSAHLVIDTDGSITQLVPFDTVAWHAGPSQHDGYSQLNQYSIGIELVNPGYLRRVVTSPAPNAASAAPPKVLYKDSTGRIVSAGDRFLGATQVIMAKHPIVGSGDIYWPVYSEAQLEALDKVVAAITATYPIMDIVSHEEIDTRGWKTDPGPAFPMDRYKRFVEHGDDTNRYSVTASSLNARTGPGTNYAVKSTFPRGKVLNISGFSGDWARIDSDLWVNKSYLARTK